MGVNCCYLGRLVNVEEEGEEGKSIVIEIIDVKVGDPTSTNESIFNGKMLDAQGSYSSSISSYSENIPK